MDKGKVIKLLSSDQTLATTLNVILVKQYGVQAYNWDLVTIAMELKDDFNVDIPADVANRIGAIQTIMLNNAVFTQLDAFMAVCNTLATGEPYFSMFDPVTTEEAAWGISEISLNRDILPFSGAIKEYMGVMLSRDGYNETNYPELFSVLYDDIETDTAQVRDVLEGLDANPNTLNMEQYVDEQLGDLAYQLDQLGVDINEILADDGIFAGTLED
jgi:hypothetical protein